MKSPEPTHTQHHQGAPQCIPETRRRAALHSTPSTALAGKTSRRAHPRPVVALGLDDIGRFYAAYLSLALVIAARWRVEDGELVACETVHEVLLRYDLRFGAFPAWLRWYLRRRLIDALRSEDARRKREAEAVRDGGSAHAAHDQAGEELRFALAEAMTSLAPEEQEVLRWRFDEALSYEDIAARREVQPATVRSWVCRLCHKLRDRLHRGGYRVRGDGVQKRRGQRRMRRSMPTPQCPGPGHTRSPALTPRRKKNCNTRTSAP